MSRRDDLRLWAAAAHADLVELKDRLHDGAHLCPVCGEMKLTPSESAMSVRVESMIQQLATWDAWLQTSEEVAD